MTESIVVPRKRCSRCKRWFPASIRYFSKYKSLPDGLSAKCRGCGWNISDDEFQRFVLHDALIAKGFKLCMECYTIKSLDAFAIHQHSTGGRRPECNHCKHDKRQEYENRSDVLEHKRAYRRRPDVQAKRREYERSPRYRELKHAYDIRPDRKALRSAQFKTDEGRTKRRNYYQRNKEAFRERGAMRAMRSRTKKKGALIGFSGADWQRAKNYFDGRCAVCGRLTDACLRLSADHWIPITKGGLTTPINIVPLCHVREGCSGGCNREKWHRDPLEWLIGKYGEEKALEIEARIQTYFVWVREQDGIE